MKTLSDFASVLNLRMFLVSAISIFATVFCIENNITAEIPISLIGLSVVFPVVFTIGASFRRRDLALERYGKITANLASIYMAAKYHHNNKSKAQTTNLIELREAIVGVFDCIKLDLRDVIFEKKGKNWYIRSLQIYQKLSCLLDRYIALTSF